VVEGAGTGALFCPSSGALNFVGMHREQPSSAVTLMDAAPFTASQEMTLPGPALSAAMAGSDPVDNSTLRAILEHTGLIKSLEEWAGRSSFKLQHAEDVPDVVFLDLSAGMGSEFALAQELSKLRPSVHIIACTAKFETNPEFLLQAMRSGVRDFLQKPYNRVEVLSLLARLRGERDGSAGLVPSHGRRCSVTRFEAEISGSRRARKCETPGRDFVSRVARLP